MKKIVKFLIVIALAVSAGVFSSSAFADGYEPWNLRVAVSYNGDVIRYDLKKEIESCVHGATERGFYLSGREKRKKIDGLQKMGLPFEAACEYVLPNFTKLAEHFGYLEKNRKDAEVSFGKRGFSYSEGIDGVEVDLRSLVYASLRSNGKEITVKLPLIIDKAVTVADLKKNTAVKSSFTTAYYGSGANRAHNVATAAESVNGTTVGAGEKFSFNSVVGPRTELNGYKTSKIILDGKYTDGVGGGVCQVSTTLYNALLLAGFVPNAAQHSLVSNYVMAGFDAMVSYGSSDLTFVNATEHPVYISAETRGKTVTFTVYGEPNEYSIVRENEETREPFGLVELIDDSKYPELIYEDQTKVITNGSDGVKTKSFLLYYKNGQLVKRRQIRSNSYKKVDKVIARGSLVRPAAAETE